MAPRWLLSDDLPATERLHTCETEIARVLAPSRLSPRPDAAFQAQILSYLLPDMAAMTCFLTPARLECPGSDPTILLLLRPMAGPMIVHQHGMALRVEAGHAVLVGLQHPLELDLEQASRVDGLRLPRRIFSPRWDGALSPGHTVSKDNTALQLLTHYGGAILRGLFPLISPQQQQLAASHMQDLTCLIFGEATPVTKEDGIAAARLRAIKADIETLIGSSDLSTDLIAARQKVSPRYVQKLFENDGLSFSEFVLERRLDRAWHLLHRPSTLGRTISSIAYEVGFSDLSYFNRTFRRRFGMSPSESRRRRTTPAAAHQPTP